MLGAEDKEEAALVGAPVTSPARGRKLAEYGGGNGALGGGQWSAVEWLGDGAGRRRPRSVSAVCSVVLRCGVGGDEGRGRGLAVAGGVGGGAVVGCGGEGTSRLGWRWWGGAAMEGRSS